MMPYRPEIFPMDRFQMEGLARRWSGPFDKSVSCVDKQHDDSVFLRDWERIVAVILPCRQSLDTFRIYRHDFHIRQDRIKWQNSCRKYPVTGIRLAGKQYGNVPFFV